MAKKAKKGGKADEEEVDDESKQPKKGKKGRGKHDESSDDEPAAAQPAPAQEPQSQELNDKVGKKRDKKAKKKKGKHDDFSDDDDAPQPSTAPKSSKKSKKAAIGFDILTDDQEPAAEEDGDEGADEEGLLVVVEVFEVKKHPKSSAHKIATLFDGDNLFKVVTEALDLEKSALVVLAKPGCVLPGGKNKVGVRKVQGVKSEGQLCSAFDIGWAEEDDAELLIVDEDWSLMSGDTCPMGPPQGWIASQQAKEAEAAPSEAEDAASDEERGAAGPINAFAGLEEAAGSEDDEAAAPPSPPQAAPKKAPVKKGGKNKKAAALNAFAGLGIDDDEDDAPPAPSSPPAEAPKAAPKKAKKALAANAFADLGGSDDEATSSPPPVARKAKSKKSAAADAFSGLGLDDDEADAASAPSAPAKGGKGKKKKSAAASAFEDLLGDVEDQEGTAGDAPAASKQKAAAAGSAEEGDIDSLMADVSLADKGAQAPAASGKKDKKKKKGGAAAAPAEDDEFDAILKELGGAPSAAPAAGPSTSAAAPAEAEEALDTVEAVEAALAAPNISATRKKKLKAKLKQLQEAAGGGGDADAAAGGDEDDGAHTTVEALQKALENKDLNANQKKKLKAKLKKLQDKEASDADAAAGKGGKGKKQSAAVLAMQREVEERRAREEAAAAARAAQLKAEEDARLAYEAEEKRLEEERLARLEAKKAKKEELRKAGKLLSAKQKAEQARLALVREQLMASAKEKGISIEELEDSKAKKPVYDAKKKAAAERKRKLEEERIAQEAEAARLEAEAEAERKRQEAEEQAKQAEVVAEPEEEDDDVADAWDADTEEEEEVKEEEAAVAVAEEADAGSAGGSAEGSESESGESGSESDSESDSGSDSDSDSGSESDSDSTDSEDERQRRIDEARAQREKRFAVAMRKRDKNDLRSPICCILGHVDTGKTKILDNIRRTNVQDNEAGGITQQIGATYIPAASVEMRTETLRAGKPFDMKMPGLLVIDTPGHESFTNLRTRGSSLCDIAVLVVDIMHGLEQQTIESIELLKQRKAPFIIALNKIDRMYQWATHKDMPVRESLELQLPQTQEEFERRMHDAMLALNEQGLNVELYWKNKNQRSYVNIVPTSAITGEGVNDLMWLIVRLTQSMMTDRLMFVEELQCTVLEVKVVEGYGHTVDAVLVNGRIREGDRIVLCGLDGPIVTNIRSLLTPHPMKELRVKGTYLHHKEVKAAQGIKISGPNLEKAVAGTQLYVVGPDDVEEDLCALVMEDMADIFSKVDKTGEGVCVQSSTLGSLEALLAFLSSDKVKIPVSGINIGPVHKKDIMRANVMAEKKMKKYACILAFDVPVNREAAELAAKMGVRIFTADIIYHLFDQFTEHMKQCKLEEQEAAKFDAVFPCRLRIMPGCVFNAKDPILLGVEVVEGQARIGAPMVVLHGQDVVDLGKITGLEKDHKAVDKADRGDSVAVKLEGSNSLFGRHFTIQDELISRISRESINSLKQHFRDEMTRQDWEMIIRLKKQFHID